MIEDSDYWRFEGLVEQYGLKFERFNSRYVFDDFTADGFRQALGYAEGYDRALREFAELSY